MIRRNLVLVLPMLGMFTAAAHAQDAKSAEAFLQSVYAGYKAKGHPIDLTGPKAETILAPSLAALLREDEKAIQGEVGVIDGDPICACQDFDIRAVAVAVSVQPDGAGKAKATASFKNLGHATRIRFDLVASDGAWRIFDIQEDELPSLRKALAAEIAAVKAEQAKPSR